MHRRLGYLLHTHSGVAGWLHPLIVHGQIYYVDATAGNDANDGLSPQRPWQTIGKVNGSAFNPGDWILFKRGETWVGTTLIVPSSGTQDNAIVFGAYGSGAKPIIDGNDLVECIQATNKTGLKFENIEVTQGINSGFQFNTCAYVDVLNCDAHDCGNDNLVFITSCHHCSVVGGEFYNGYQRVAGTIVSGIEIADGSHDIVINSVVCRNQVGGILSMGLTIHSHAATSMPYNIEVKDSEFHDNTGNGIQVLKDNNTADPAREIIIHNNTAYSNTLDGIRLYKSGGATAYPAGVEVYDNYVHSNARYAYWIEGDFHLIRNNVFRGRGFLSACDTVNFYNNTMYFEVGGGLYPIYIQDARTKAVQVKNNIVFATAVGGMMMGVANTVPAAGGVDIDYNLYYLALETVLNTRWHWRGVNHNWANWLLNSGQDANSPMADQDPLFTDAANGDFTLQAGSPAIDVGEDVGLPYNGAAPDLGAFEHA